MACLVARKSDTARSVASPFGLWSHCQMRFTVRKRVVVASQPGDTKANSKSPSLAQLLCALLFPHCPAEAQSTEKSRNPKPNPKPWRPQPSPKSFPHLPASRRWNYASNRCPPTIPVTAARGGPGEFELQGFETWAEHWMPIV